MNVNVNLNLDPVLFYQQKQLLFDFLSEYTKSGAYAVSDMLCGIINIFDEIGDQAEDQGEFTYPEMADDEIHFKDEMYNDVLYKLLKQEV